MVANDPFKGDPSKHDRLAEMQNAGKQLENGLAI